MNRDGLHWGYEKYDKITAVVCGEVIHNMTPEMEEQLFELQNLPVTYDCPECEIC